MPTLESRPDIKPALNEIQDIDDIYKFFGKLGYQGDVKDSSYHVDPDDFEIKEKEKEKIDTIYNILDFDGNSPVFLVHTESTSKSHIDYVTERINKTHNFCLVIFTENFDELSFVLPETEVLEPGKQKTKLTKLHVDLQNVYYSDADTLSQIILDDEKNWRQIWNQWKEAFKVERVTESFFNDYQDHFFKLREQVLTDADEIETSHEFVLQLMNRMMFIYFVDKKGWMEKEHEDESYIAYLWRRYREAGGLQDDEMNFYDDWLETLFHKGLNNKYQGQEDLPDDVSESLMKAPYLNGGLFRESDTTEISVEVEDEKIGELIEDFFERYNFTIREDMPLEEEVAVDPKMIGYVYESLSNVAEELDEIDRDSRKDFGIFYTPRDEVYFMVRRTLVEHLNEHTDVPKEDLYRLVFAESNEEKREIRKKIDEHGQAFSVRNALREANIVDPACGSGAFLVGMLNVIADINEEMYKAEGNPPNTFETKKQIIGETLYGVDVKDWAVNAAELRLFLQLLIETEVDEDTVRQEALLPNLRANLRVGDSLVQDIDGEFIDIRGDGVSKEVQQRLEELKEEKGKFFESRRKSKFDGISDIEAEEIRVFRKVLDDKIESLEEKLDEDNAKQQTLEGETKEPSASEKRKITRKKKEARKRIEKLEGLKQEMAKNPDTMPLLWDVAFAEVFESRDGFDIVIGNPPYVRQEDIRPPNMPIDDVEKSDKKEYKEKLIESVEHHMPQVDNISKRSDLYIYFFFHGLSILNDKGNFCFITSNSWLDVEYGKHLQKFLCQYIPIKGIYNNKAKRSFEHAEVNTVISLFGAPRFESKSFGGWKIASNAWPATDHDALFITFKKPYREAINTENLLALEDDENYERNIQLDRSSFTLYNTEDHRSVQITQGNLLEDGWEYPDKYEDEPFGKGKYTANKWNGKFLRAPDIFYKISDNSTLKRFSDIGEISYGFKTGANDFFFLKRVSKKEASISQVENLDDKDKLKSEDIGIFRPSQYKENSDGVKYFALKEKDVSPALQTTSDTDTLNLSNSDTFLFTPEDVSSLNTLAKKYVEWGENEGHNETYTCSKRDIWYDLMGNSNKEPTNLGFNYNIHDTGHFYFCDEPVFFSDNFHTIDTDSREIQMIGESTLGDLMINIFCRTSFGGGKAKLQTYELEKLPLVDPSEVDISEEELENWRESSDREVRLIFEEIGLKRSKPIREQEPDPLPDRKELDDIVFDALGLSEEERKEVYWAVAELVKARLDKSESV